VRDSKLSTRFTACIEATIKELLPIQQILETYMKQQGGESVDLNADEPVEDNEDPDIDENENENEPGTEPEPEPESGAEPEAGTEPSTQPGDAPPTEQTPGSPPVPGEVKNIPITGQAAQDDGVLFGDAPDEKTKVA
jgi:hypothetical protein